MSLHERRKRLEQLIPAGQGALWFSRHVEGEAGPALFRHACAMGLEGIVSKRIALQVRALPGVAQDPVSGITSDR
jgi:ATP-dependent DNA ligase